MNMVLIKGQILTEFPKDLFIPPQAMTVRLEPFEGPLDLLLYLIRNQNLDISEISIARICEQYMEYVHLMEGDLELVSKYLVLAATLAEIKSRMLLPKPTVVEEEGIDPAAALIQQLEEYERLKKSAEYLDALPRVEREIFPVILEYPLSLSFSDEKTNLTPHQLGDAFSQLMKRTLYYSKHFIRREILSVRECMTKILSVLKTRTKICFHELLKKEQGKMGVVVTLLALLELIKMATIEVEQNSPFYPTEVRVRDV